jgi:hypothetical protein
MKKGPWEPVGLDAAPPPPNIQIEPWQGRPRGVLAGSCLVVTRPQVA